MQTFRIFISSPGDVGNERKVASDIVRRLSGEFHGHARLVPYRWEEVPLRATKHFQEEILPPSASDVVICILWSRLGTRLPPELFAREDGTAYESGTEWEFEEAYEAAVKTGKPDLFVYRKNARAFVELDDETRMAEARRQKKALDSFLERWFRKPDGTFKIAYKEFQSLEEFTSTLEADLREVVRLRIKETVTATEVEPTWFSGSPFRGLMAFEYEHAPVFFGRTRALGDIMDRLTALSGQGRAFVLVSGMSGCGKSSLVRAGVIPHATHPGVVEGVGCWRWKAVRPGDLGPDLLLGLSRLLFSALPELGDSGYNEQSLADLLAEAPRHAMAPLAGALARAEERWEADYSLAKPLSARLLLFLDQFEEVFSNPSWPPEMQAGFFMALEHLARSGFAWVLATMRNEYYPACAQVPELVRLKEGLGHYDLSPPSFDEMGRIILFPAQAAGLRFERDPATDQGLNEALHEEAASQRGALPLLEFTLEALYERRTAEGILTWEAYRALGGLSGAIARRAGEVFQGLSPAALEAAPRFFRQLVAPDGEAFVGRRVPKDRLLASPEAEEILEAFLSARLLTTSAGADRESQVGLAHEALLTSWPLLAGWLEESREFLREREKLRYALSLWEEEAEKPDEFLLATGKSLAVAEALVREWGEELSVEERDFVEKSSQRARNREQRRIRILAGAVAVFAILALAAFYFGVASLRAEKIAQQAEENANQALVQEKAAREETGRALADYHARLGREALGQKRWQEAVLQFRESLGFADTYLARLGANEAMESLVPELASVSCGQKYVRCLDLSEDETRIVTGGADGSLRLWDAGDARLLASLDDAGGKVLGVRFLPGGNRILYVTGQAAVMIWDPDKAGSRPEVWRKTPSGADCLALGKAPGSPSGKEPGLRVAVGLHSGQVELCDAGTGEIFFRGTSHEGPVKSMVFSPIQVRVEITGMDGQTKSQTETRDGLVTTGADRTARLWDLSCMSENAANPDPCAQTLEGHKGVVLSAAVTPGGKWVATGSEDGTVRIWQVETGNCLAVLKGHTGPVRSVAFSPDDRLLFSSSWDETIRVWDTATRDLKAVVQGHQEDVNALAFSRAGNRLVSSSDDGTLRFWGLPVPVKNSLAGHLDAVNALAESPDGRFLASGSWDHGVGLWNLETREPEMLFLGHDSGVTGLAFLPGSGTLASTSWDKTVRLWDLASMKAGPVFPLPSRAQAIAVYPADSTLWCACVDGGLRVMDTGMGASRTLAGHKGAVNALAASPDGTLFASGGADGTVRLWNGAEGRLLSTRVHSEGVDVNAGGSGPGGENWASGGADGRRVFWTMGDEKPGK
ncbi:MAG: hypothetical protein ABIM40_00665, partial [Pseudomonadota bacterium]